MTIDLQFYVTSFHGLRLSIFLTGEDSEGLYPSPFLYITRYIFRHFRIFSSSSPFSFVHLPTRKDSLCN
ncbi:hypothetical protein L2E82_41101 [Cichorium intybus]|uniref:Uncharacterized protein n=1 Tax=Cichorium intybus TaxID=13427 RepID=A0ACB9AMD1_CICIN|nr:hypothetical protein L2E82_41101 [Cichorium intybus]